MDRLTVLLTNVRVGGRSGTECYLRDVALELVRRNHRPIVFSTELGPLADELQAATVSVVDDLSAVGVTPDIIHGHHVLETCAAVCHFPRTPAVFVAHDWDAWFDTPPALPRIRRFVAVDETVRDRLISQHGIRPEATRVLFNATDLHRFTLRAALPTRPRRALVFSNYMKAADLKGLRAACTARRIDLDAVGREFGSGRDDPENLLREYDVVFAKGRSAREAVASGCAVIVCDRTGAGPLVTADGFEQLASLNFGRRLLRHPLSEDWIGSQLDRYDAADAAVAAARLRESCGPEALVDQLLDLYGTVIDEQRSEPLDAEQDLRAVSDLLQWLAAQIQGFVRYESKRRSFGNRLLRRFGKGVKPGYGRPASRRR